MCEFCEEKFEEIESNQIYDFTFVDEYGEITNFHKEIAPIEGNIEDVLLQMKNFLLACGFNVDSLTVNNEFTSFSV